MTEYEQYAARFAVDRELVCRCIAAYEPLIIESISVYGTQHFWRGELPMYVVMTTPEENGGWGHLMPVWFKPHERPVPLHTLNNWGLFALVYARSFGSSEEAQRLIAQVFTAEHLIPLIVGANAQIPFLPTTQGRGYFFRQGMLPFLLSILWLKEDVRQGWLRLHELGAEHFIASRGLAHSNDVIETLNELEFTIFARIERNNIKDDAAVAAFLASGPAEPSGAPSLLRLYEDMFGAINLGVAALAAHYERKKSLHDWRSWIEQEIGVAYRMSDYAVDAIQALLQRYHG